MKTKCANDDTTMPQKQAAKQSTVAAHKDGRNTQLYKPVGFDLSGPSITVNVKRPDSNSSVSFSVHKALVCRTSKYFRSTLNDQTQAEYYQLAKAYVFGGFLTDIEFQNAVLDCILRKSEMNGDLPVGPAVSFIYRHTLPYSKARVLLVDMYTYLGHSAMLGDEVFAEADSVPVEFLRELTISLWEWRDYGGSMPKIQASKYHEHKSSAAGCWPNIHCPGGHRATGRTG